MIGSPGIDNKLRQTVSGSTSYFLTDHLGTTRALTDSAGSITFNLAYDAYGNVVSGSASTRYTYTGRELDSDTGLMYYRARWYEPVQGRFISEDPMGFVDGTNLYNYVKGNSLNSADPSGLYEIDVHYYLTYFLARKTGCFNHVEAGEIANGDQGVDENPATAPAYGDSDRQRQVNSFYHGLHSGSHQPYLDAHWFNATQGQSGSLSGLGVYLHYLQDSFSHGGYTDARWGHATGFHAVDKTDDDVPKAMRMAGASWNALNKFASEKKCGCHGTFDPMWWKQVERFAQAPGGGPYDRRRHSIDEIDPSYLNRKIQILGVPRRDQ